MDQESSDLQQNRLKELLAWKKHEQPPPGFFATFSTGVIAELQQRGEIQVSWWESLQNRLTGPVFACTYGAAIGAALVIGIGFSDPEETSQPLQASSFTQTTAAGWSDPGNSIGSRIPTLEAGDYPSLFGPTTSSSSRPVIHSGPVSFLMDTSPAMVEKASFQFR